MQGMQIIRQSAQQIIHNIGPALRISGILYVLFLATDFYSLSFAADKSMPEQESLVVLFPLVTLTVALLWSAVGWHRFILKGELPNTFLPKFHLRRLMSYFWRGALLVMMVFISVFIGWVVAGVAGFTDENGSIIGNYGVFITLSLLPGFYVFYRLSPILPATAIGEKLSPSNAWRNTKELKGAIVLLLVVDAVLEGISFVLPQELSLPYVLWNTFPGWAVFMFNISVITTLYEHCVEGRDFGGSNVSTASHPIN